MLHELGHSYGLDHDESGIALMNLQKPRAKNCSAGVGYRGYPMPDDYQGYLQYHKSYSGTRYNVAGTPWYKSGGFGQLDYKTPIVSSSTPASFILKVTYHSFFAHKWNGGNEYYAVRFWAVPDGTAPSFNRSTGLWTMPSGAQLLPYITYMTLPGWYSHTISLVMDLYAKHLPSLGKFRIWVYVDQSQYVPEVEEDDNVFPTNVVITRI